MVIKFLITNFLEILVGLTLLTQILIPFFIPDLKLFWIFRSENNKDIEEANTPVTKVDSLETLDSEATFAKSNFESVKNKVNDVEQQLKKIKEKTNS